MKVVGKDAHSNYYPRVTCDLDKVRHNTEEVMRRAKAAGIQVAAVVKGVNGLLYLTDDSNVAVEFI